MVAAAAGGLKHTTVCLEPTATAAAAVTATAAVAAVAAADTPGGGGNKIFIFNWLIVKFCTNILNYTKVTCIMISVIYTESEI